MRIVDCDSHFITSTIFDNVSEQYKHLVPKYKVDEENRITDISFSVDPVKINYNKSKHTMYCQWAGMSNITERIKYLNEYGIDKQFLGPQEYAMRFNTSVDDNLAAEMAHSFNLEVKKVVDLYPEKFFTAALIPIQNIDLALKEVDWAIENNLKTIYMDIKILNFDDKLSYPLSTIKDIDLLFEKCEKNNICMYLHTSMDRPNIAKQYVPYYKKINGNTALTGKDMMIYDLISSGILDSFPKIKIVIGEVYDYIVINCYKHLKQSYLNTQLLNCKKDPLHYFKNNLYVTIDIEKIETLNYMIDEFGSDRLLFSTDYPHDDVFGKNKFKDVEDLKNSTMPIQDLENIAYKNAEKLFGL